MNLILYDWSTKELSQFLPFIYLLNKYLANYLQIPDTILDA